MNAVEQYIRPHLLRAMTAPAVSQLQGDLRRAGKREATIAKHLRAIKAMLRWANRMGLLLQVPAIEMPKRAKGAKHMKGRPISAEEFQAMLDVVPGVVGEYAAPSWRHYLRGLLLSGLRVAESLELYWDRQDRLSVDLTGQFPLLRIRAEFEKGYRDRVLPIAPDFGDFLQETQAAERVGRVFKLIDHLNGLPLTNKGQVSKLCGQMGRKAGIVANTDALTGKVTYASLHDLRRTFGERWSAEVMPQVLKEIMRHETIDTTTRFYVGQNVNRTAAVLQEAHRKKSALAVSDQSRDNQQSSTSED